MKLSSFNIKMGQQQINFKVFFVKKIYNIILTKLPINLSCNIVIVV